LEIILPSFNAYIYADDPNIIDAASSVGRSTGDGTSFPSFDAASSVGRSTDDHASFIDAASSVGRSTDDLIIYL